jgi:glycosyltransferase involved in cell wall biosynthesis
MRIVYVYADNPKEWNSSEWRCAVPARAMNRSGCNSAEMISMVDFANNPAKANDVCGPADVIVVQRNFFGPVLSAIQHWKARDKVVIGDFDDAFDLMPPSNPSYAFWSQGIVRRSDGSTERMDPPPLTQFKWGLRLLHAATVPSKRLADDWRSYAEMFYLPNYIDLEKYQNVTPEPHDGIIIGWGGSISHLQSFTESGVLTALKRVVRSRPQVRVMICGNDRRILDSLSIPPDRLVHQPWTAYTEWSQTLSRFDIGLAPLYGAYDERRSWIKVMEYMLMKIPWVASEGPTYHDLRAYGWLVKNNASAWERVLLDMIDHLEDYRLEVSREPYLYALSQGVDENIQKITNTYASIASQCAGISLANTGARVGSDRFSLPARL